MKIITLTAILTSRGIRYMEKEDTAFIKGAHTYVTEHGTYINAKTMMVVKETLNNTVPTYKPAMMGFKIVCLDGDQHLAKNLVYDKFKEILKNAATSLNELQSGFAIEERARFKENPMPIRRRRIHFRGEEGNQ